MLFKFPVKFELRKEDGKLLANGEDLNIHSLYQQDRRHYNINHENCTRFRRDLLKKSCAHLGINPPRGVNLGDTWTQIFEDELYFKCEYANDLVVGRTEVDWLTWEDWTRLSFDVIPSWGIMSEVLGWDIIVPMDSLVD